MEEVEVKAIKGRDIGDATRWKQIVVVVDVAVDGEGKKVHVVMKVNPHMHENILKRKKKGKRYMTSML